MRLKEVDGVEAVLWIEKNAAITLLNLYWHVMMHEKGGLDSIQIFTAKTPGILLDCHSGFLPPLGTIFSQSGVKPAWPITGKIICNAAGIRLISPWNITVLPSIQKAAKVFLDLPNLHGVSMCHELQVLCNKALGNRYRGKAAWNEDLDDLHYVWSAPYNPNWSKWENETRLLLDSGLLKCLSLQYCGVIWKECRPHLGYQNKRIAKIAEDLIKYAEERNLAIGSVSIKDLQTFIHLGEKLKFAMDDDTQNIINKKLAKKVRIYIYVDLRILRFSVNEMHTRCQIRLAPVELQGEEYWNNPFRKTGVITDPDTLAALIRETISEFKIKLHGNH